MEIKKLASVQPQSKIKSSGFSLIEVLISIVVITTFTLTALQALVLSTVFKVKSEQSSRAANWIQEEVEEARFEAAFLDPNSDGLSVAATALCDASTASSGYSQALETQLQSVASITGSYNVGSSYTGFGKVAEAETAGKNIPGQDVWLLRKTTPKDPDVLILEYLAVLEDNSGTSPSTDENDIVAELYTEVIPDEAFACD